MLIRKEITIFFINAGVIQIYNQKKLVLVIIPGILCFGLFNVVSAQTILLKDRQWGDGEIIFWDPVTKTLTLKADLDRPVIIENVSGITLDGNGFSITCDSKVMGIRVRFNNNITIKNISILNCLYGISTYYSNNNHFFDIKIMMCIVGLRLETSSFNVISGNSLYQCFGGIGLSVRSNDNLITNNIVETESNGIALNTNSSNNTVSDNRVYNYLNPLPKKGLEMEYLLKDPLITIKSSATVQQVTSME